MFALSKADKDKDFDAAYNEVNSKFEDTRVLAYQKVIGGEATKREARAAMQKAQLTFTV